MNDGGPAFPWGEYGSHLGGMSLRDYFAAAAMQGILADPSVKDMAKFLDGGVKQCYQVADAMLAERDK